MNTLEKLNRDFVLIDYSVVFATNALCAEKGYEDAAARDATRFMLYPALTGGKLTAGKLDVINAVVEGSVTAESATEIIAGEDYDSYMHCIPVSLQILVAMDNVLVWNNMDKEKNDMPSLFIELYKAMGEAVMYADGDASDDAKAFLNNCIHNFGEYVNEVSERRHKYGLIDYA